MAGQPEPAVPARARVPDVGLRRVSWVRVVLGTDGARCHVAGLLHRRPVVLGIPLSTASALIESGVPALVVGKRASEPAHPLAAPPVAQLT